MEGYGGVLTKYPGKSRKLWINSSTAITRPRTGSLKTSIPCTYFKLANVGIWWRPDKIAWKKIRKPKPTRNGAITNMLLHYLAPRDLEKFRCRKFRCRSTTTRGGTLKNFALASLPRAEGLRNFRCRSTTTRRESEKFCARSTTTRGGNSKNFILHYHAPRDFEIFRSRSTTTRRGTMKFLMSLHYHARWDFEKFRSRSTTTCRGTLKFSMSLHYHAPLDLEKFRCRSTTTHVGTLKNFALAPLPRAEGL